jgi:chromosomal replication initiator protein
MAIPIESLWSQVLERLQLQLSRPTFETWIKTASAERFEDNCLVIRTPNPFARNWLQKYYIKTIANVVQDIVGYPVEIYITVAQGEEVSEFQERETHGVFSYQNHISDNPVKNQPKTPELNLKYVFSRC